MVGNRARLTLRIARLMQAAMSRRYMPPLDELAREHGVCRRTIRRDLEVIERLVPVRWRQVEAE